MTQDPRASASTGSVSFDREDRIRILKFVALFGCGGTERQFLNLGLSLDRSQFDLRFACMKRQGRFLEEVETRGILVDEYRLKRFASMRCAAQQVRLARNIVRHRVDVVHAYNFYGNVFAVPAARLAAAPVVIASIRDQGVYLTSRQKAVQRHVCRLADRILVNADSIRDWLVREGYPARRIVVIRNGIDLSQFPGRGAVAPGDDLRRQIGISSDAPLIATVSRLSPSKGIEHFLDAVAVVVARHPSAHALVIGEGLTTKNGVVVTDRAYVSSLHERARRLGIADRVTFTGYRSDIPAVLSQVSVSVLPSLSEGLSNAVLESMAAGAPVVATRVGGTPEIVAHGSTGLLVPAADARALAEGMGHLLDEPTKAAAMGVAGRRSVEDRFSMGQMVQATEDVYRDLLARRMADRRRRARAGLLRRALVWI